MSGSDPYKMTTPCPDCPFRNDRNNGCYLTKDRVREIEQSLVQSEFPCHKTLDYSEEDWQETEHTIHCAGALILLEKMERPSQMMRISERLGMYDRRKLDMDAPVYDSFDEMEDAAQDTILRKRPKRKAKRA